MLIIDNRMRAQDPLSTVLRACVSAAWAGPDYTYRGILYVTEAKFARLG
jgi:hypothetical protein